jgi:hypothetical protein
VHEADAEPSTPAPLPQTVTGAEAATAPELPLKMPELPPLLLEAEVAPDGSPPAHDPEAFPTPLPHTVTGTDAATAAEFPLATPPPVTADGATATTGADVAGGAQEPVAVPSTPAPLPQTVIGRLTETAASLPLPTAWAPATPPPASRLDAMITLPTVAPITLALPIVSSSLGVGNGPRLSRAVAAEARSVFAGQEAVGRHS